MRNTAPFAGIHSRRGRMVHHGGGAHPKPTQQLDPRLVAGLLRQGQSDGATLGEAVVRAAAIAAATHRSMRSEVKR